MTEDLKTAPDSRSTAVRGRNYLLLAWVSVVAMPLLLLTPSLVATNESSDPGDTDPLITTTGMTGWLLMLTAAIAAVALGLAARRNGRSTGIFPALIGGASAAWQVTILLVGVVMEFAFGVA